VVDKGNGIQPLKTYLETSQDPIDKRAFYRAVYNGLAQSQPALNVLEQSQPVLNVHEQVTETASLASRGSSVEGEDAREAGEQEEALQFEAPALDGSNDNDTGAGFAGVSAATGPKPPPPKGPYPAHLARQVTEDKTQYLCLNGNGVQTGTLFENDAPKSSWGDMSVCRHCFKKRSKHAKVDPVDIEGGYLARKLSFRIKKRKTNKKITRKRKSPRKSHRK
jgi:hypothetical protein